MSLAHRVADCQQSQRYESNSSLLTWVVLRLNRWALSRVVTFITTFACEFLKLSKDEAENHPKFDEFHIVAIVIYL